MMNHAKFFSFGQQVKVEYALELKKQEGVKRIDLLRTTESKLLERIYPLFTKLCHCHASLDSTVRTFYIVNTSCVLQEIKQ